MHPDIPPSLAGIVPGEATPEGFAAAAGMDAERAARAMEWWLGMGIGSRPDGTYLYEPGERLEAGIKLLEAGLDVGTVAPHLHWRDFEGLAGRILESEGYEVAFNHIMTGPRMEIDVVGIRLDVAILADCKHWRRSTSVSGAAARQEARARRWSRLHGMASVPVVVTLLEGPPSAGRVPVVPVRRLRSFAAEIFGNVEELAVTPEGWRGRGPNNRS